MHDKITQSEGLVNVTYVKNTIALVTVSDAWVLRQLKFFPMFAVLNPGVSYSYKWKNRINNPIYIKYL